VALIHTQQATILVVGTYYVEDVETNKQRVQTRSRRHGGCSRREPASQNMERSLQDVDIVSKVYIDDEVYIQCDDEEVAVVSYLLYKCRARDSLVRVCNGHLDEEKAEHVTTSPE